MFEYFWLEKTLLPGRLGYSAFTPPHFIALGLIAVSVAAALRWLAGLPEVRRDRVLRFLVLLLPAAEVFKDVVVAVEIGFGSNYYPCFLCSFAMYVFPIIVFSRSGRLRTLAGDFALVVNLPAALMALLFANWVDYYPPVSFFSLYCYLYHALLIVIALALWSAGRIRLTKRSVFRALAELVCFSPVILLLDRVLGQNYWFLEEPDLNNPFLGIYERTGYPLYLACLAAAALVLCTLTWAILYTVQRRREETL